MLVSFISHLVFCSVFSLFLFGFIFSESLDLVRIFGVVWKQLKIFISITARICTTLITRNSSRAGQPLSHVNLTGFRTPTSG